LLLLGLYLHEIIKRECFERGNITHSMVFLYFINIRMVNIYEWRMNDFVISETNDDKGRGLYAKKRFSTENVVLILEGTYLPYPTKTSIQVGNKHLESWEGGHVNHHCKPNTKVVQMMLVALKNIEIGDEITFDYETTEAELAVPFKCACHGRLIIGFNTFQRVV